MLCHARSWAVAGAYLGCFGFGTFLAMSAFTALVGELSSQLGRKFDDPSAPAKFAKVSSIIALTSCHSASDSWSVMRDILRGPLSQKSLSLSASQIRPAQ